MNDIIRRYILLFQIIVIFVTVLLSMYSVFMSLINVILIN